MRVLDFFKDINGKYSAKRIIGIPGCALTIFVGLFVIIYSVLVNSDIPGGVVAALGVVFGFCCTLLGISVTEKPVVNYMGSNIEAGIKVNLEGK